MPVNQIVRNFRVPIQIVFYKEDGRWFAHCLEFDLIGDGADRESAGNNLAEAIKLQVESSIEAGNPANLFTPAPSEIFERFAEGKDSAIGIARFQISMDHYSIQGVSVREYSQAQLACA